MTMRVLVGDGTWDWPETPWLRANMVSSVDGAAQGADGLSGTVNNAVDRDVFARLRRDADLVLVGGGTARAETYTAGDTPIAVVSRSGLLPDSLREAPPESVWVEPGGDDEALRAMVARLYAAGHRRILTEGGPHLLAALLRAGVVDELCTTVTPRLLAGPGGRILTGPAVDVPLRLHSLVEQDSTLLARWLVLGSSRG